MIDPSVPLADFQKAVKRNRLELLPCKTDPTLWVHFDQPTGDGARMTYVRFKGREVTAFVMFAPADAYKGLRCFSVGYATPKAYQGRGHAKEILRAAIAEIKHVSREFGFAAFYVDACVSIKNIASQHVAESVFGTVGTLCTDSFSGESALQYFLKVTTD